MSRTLPTIITLRQLEATVPLAPAAGLTWSDDGQCALIMRDRVIIATPYLTSTFPAPTIPLDSSIAKGMKAVRGGNQSDDSDNEVDVDEPRQPHRNLKRSHGGEVKFWISGVEFDRSAEKEEDYGWANIGDEVTGMITEKERGVRAAVWSPSGMGKNAGSLLVVVSNTFQVSLFAPGVDPYRTELVEIEDITLETRKRLPADEQEQLTPWGLLRLRAMCMAWSEFIPVQSMIGEDGSLLAIANRAGGVDFWSYAGSKLAHVGEIAISTPWVSRMSWSSWTVEDDACFASLALAATDGSIFTVNVRRRAVDGKWDIEVEDPHQVAPADKRLATYIKWVKTGYPNNPAPQENMLVWCRPGTVHMATQKGISSVRLQRVGNWAGCNGLDPCIGLHVTAPDTLTVVLSSLTYHVIQRITSNTPTLAPLDSLRPTLSSRDIALEGFRNRRRKYNYASERELTTHVVGWEAMDASGDIVSFLDEPIPFHNLDSATDVHRVTDFVVANLQTTSREPKDLTSELARIMDHPPDLLYYSPLAVLMPQLLHILTSDVDPIPHLLLDVLSSPPRDMNVAAEPGSDPIKSLMTAVWGHRPLDVNRLRYVAAQWAQRTFPAASNDFGAVAETYFKALERLTAAIQLSWATKFGGDIGKLDAQYLRNLATVAGSSQDVPESVRQLAESDDSGDLCPACGGAVPSGQGACIKGHKWERCSVTHLLITTPECRLCTVCPAVALLPRSLGGEESEGDTLVQAALEAAAACIMCGGRWAKPV